MGFQDLLAIIESLERIMVKLQLYLQPYSSSWNEAVKKAFSILKQAMCNTLVLVVPDFSNIFVLECDASRKGLGFILMQEGHRLTFMSEYLYDNNLGKSTNEKEFMAILHVLETWWPYLIGRKLQIKTNHHSLKDFLEKYYLPQNNINGSPRCLDMIMRSSIIIKKAKTMLQQMHYQENMMTMDPSFPFPVQYHNGQKNHSKNGQPIILLLNSLRYFRRIPTLPKVIVRQLVV